jgi:hypothetical protein
MATDVRHAATQDDKKFSVEVRTERGTVVVAEALSEFLDAFDSAMEWLEREDPERTQSLTMGIFATHAGVAQQVWAYPAEASAHAAEKTTSLVNVFGFDPVAWRPQAREFDVARSRPHHEPSPASFRATSGTEHDVEAAGDDVEVDPEADEVYGAALDASDPAAAGSSTLVERLEAWLARSSRLQLGRTFRVFWADRVSRTWLILGAILLWLGVTLLAPEFLAPLPGVVLGLWICRARRAAPSADTADDWF